MIIKGFKLGLLVTSVVLLAQSNSASAQQLFIDSNLQDLTIVAGDTATVASDKPCEFNLSSTLSALQYVHPSFVECPAVRIALSSESDLKVESSNGSVSISGDLSALTLNAVNGSAANVDVQLTGLLQLEITNTPATISAQASSLAIEASNSSIELNNSAVDEISGAIINSRTAIEDSAIGSGRLVVKNRPISISNSVANINFRLVNSQVRYVNSAVRAGSTHRISGSNASISFGKLKCVGTGITDTKSYKPQIFLTRPTPTRLQGSASIMNYKQPKKRIERCARVLISLVNGKVK